MVIDHIGVVVRSLEAGMHQWEELFGYVRSCAIVTNTRQKVNVVFMAKHGSMTVKLIEPSDADSPIASFARKGGGLHHICFRCDGVTSSIPRLQELGARMIAPPQPGEAFCNHDIAFLLVPGNLNIELIDASEKYGWADPPRQ
jgi:methylmalonyl-CoA/ethylmalonyl-CoA epimerase